ncbi:MULTISPECIES: hypothetical protein [Prochlorococcus]|uniref:Aspartyl/asparaginy/proline hydroxylase domain-containing protein n=1 Tax=Prochlorococcus marinus str. MIT 9314 TaxID=167548 RepID=A0A0A2AIL2_PROMR|nr:hypothetical protein [Prochlorococcus marinus]KGG00269.1 hypothetical protein EU98_1801 [Prochlorococcus marinus str. MIT 9314]
MFEEKNNTSNNISIKDFYNIYQKVKESHYIFNCSDIDELKKIHQIAINDLKKSIPEYYSFEEGSPNFRKSNYQNKKSIVNGYFEQYNYFPWNKNSESIFIGLKDPLNLFFQINNLYCIEKKGSGYFELTGLKSNRLFNKKYFVRVCYQHFPRTKGYLSIHRDPIGSHQFSAPIISLSELKKQGLYYILNNDKINVQSVMSYGDALYVDQSRLHAVEHDLEKDKGTEHFLISVHRYHSDSSFLQSSTK